MKFLNRLYNPFTMLLVLVLAIGFVAVASAWAVEHKVTFEWTYPAEQSNIINGFRLYNATNPDKPVAVATLKQGGMRMVELIVDLQDGENLFFISPYIGDREGVPSAPISVQVSPMFQATGLKAICPTCK